MKEFTFSAAKDLLISKNLLDSEVIESSSGQSSYCFHVPTQNIVKDRLDSFTIHIDKIESQIQKQREHIATVEKRVIHSDMITVHGQELVALKWVEKLFVFLYSRRAKF